MKWNVIIAFVFVVNSAFSQSYKDDISVVQFSAGFVKEAEMDLKKFREYNTFTFYMENDADIFAAEGIKYVPTLVIFQNGKEIMRIGS